MTDQPPTTALLFLDAGRTAGGGDPFAAFFQNHRAQRQRQQQQGRNGNERGEQEGGQGNRSATELMAQFGRGLLRMGPVLPLPLPPVCPLVRPPVCPSVHSSVRLSLGRFVPGRALYRVLVCTMYDHPWTAPSALQPGCDTAPAFFGRLSGDATFRRFACRRSLCRPFLIFLLPLFVHVLRFAFSFIIQNIFVVPMLFIVPSHMRGRVIGLLFFLYMFGFMR